MCECNQLNSLKACTGTQGEKDAWEMSMQVGHLLSSLKKTKDTSNTLVLSTGVIGQTLQMDKIQEGIHSLTANLESSPEAWELAAQAFMTTDTFPKLRVKVCTLPSGSTYRIAGIAKGAGMIHPNMATLLGVFVTDLNIDKATLKLAHKYAMDRSFNSISVDGDTSTNDSIITMA